MLHLGLVIIIVFQFHNLAESTPLAPAIYVFGDSLLDNGNNNWLPTAARANFPPYGCNFPTPVPLGRFTNGRTTVDFLAEYMGLPYPPPYASLFGPNSLGLPNPLPNASLFNPISFSGYNYASASCGILPESGSNLGRCYNLDEQIEMFRQTVESQLPTITYKDSSTEEIGEKLSKSIIIVGIGSNDYLNNYFLPISIRKHLDPSQFAQLLLDQFSRQFQRLYSIGARKIIVTNVAPLGCIPTGARQTMATLFSKGKCDEEANSILQIFNKKLPLLLNNLTTCLQGSYFIFVNIYSLNYDAITNPIKYGLKESTKPCCKTIDGKFLCIPKTTTCSNSDKYFFWDGYHPTEAIYSVLANEFFNGSSIISPINVNQLVQL